jgi:molybdopterin molybdotransferase
LGVRERISLDDARAAVIARLAGFQPACERMSTAEPEELVGRTLGETLFAPMNLPPFANSAMDGYALRAADLASGLDLPQLPLQGAVLAGNARQALRVGHCMRITTGAPLPVGADCVVMQEQCERIEQDGAVSIAFKVAVREAFVRPAGEDFKKGELALRVGTRLGPADLAVLHAFGLTSVRVFRKPRVVVLAGGDELQSAGAALGDGQIYESNRASLTGLLSALGARVICAPIMADSKIAVVNALRQAVKAADLVICTGGASAGDADFLVQALHENGHIHFYRLRVKPGMPALMGDLDGRCVLALPGNPVSVFMSFLTLAKPAVELLCGREPSALRPFFIKLAVPVHKTHARREFLRAQLDYSVPGEVLVRPLPAQGSAMLRGLVQADGLIDLPEGEQHLAAGDTVAYLGFHGLLG